VVFPARAAAGCICNIARVRLKPSRFLNSIDDTVALRLVQTLRMGGGCSGLFGNDTQTISIDGRRIAKIDPDWHPDMKLDVTLPNAFITLDADGENPTHLQHPQGRERERA
jgi:hypothetical protein